MKKQKSTPVQVNDEATVIAKTKTRTATNKITKEAVKETKKAAKEKELKASTDDKNVKSTVKTIVKQEREVMYNYPQDIDNPLDRKKFRQKVRNSIRAFERNLHKIEDTESKEYKKLNKEYQAYRKEVLLVP